MSEPIKSITKKQKNYKISYILIGIIFILLACAIIMMPLPDSIENMIIVDLPTKDLITLADTIVVLIFLIGFYILIKAVKHLNKAY